LLFLAFFWLLIGTIGRWRFAEILGVHTGLSFKLLSTFFKLNLPLLNLTDDLFKVSDIRLYSIRGREPVKLKKWSFYFHNGSIPHVK
jgi:hypothetical protein